MSEEHSEGEAAGLADDLGSIASSLLEWAAGLKPKGWLFVNSVAF